MLQQRCQRMLTVGQYVTRWENVLLTPNSVPLLLIPYLCLCLCERVQRGQARAVLYILCWIN